MRDELYPHIFKMSPEVEKELNNLRLPPHDQHEKRLHEKTNYQFYNSIAEILDGRYNVTAMPMQINLKINERRAQEIAASLGAQWTQYDYYKDIAVPIGKLLGPNITKATTTHTTESITNSMEQNVGDVLKKGQFFIVVYPRGGSSSHGPTDYQFEIIMKTAKKNIKRITNHLTFPSPICYVLERPGGFKENISGNFREVDAKHERNKIYREERARDREAYKEKKAAYKAKKRAKEHKIKIMKAEKKPLKKKKQTSSDSEQDVSKEPDPRMVFTNLMKKAKLTKK